MTSPQEVFVFGSNREGRHGAGAARAAVEEYGAIYGQAEGLQGRAYGIVTKELRYSRAAVDLDEIAAGVKRFLWFAGCHPELRFRLTPIGCGLAGFLPEQIAPLFQHAPPNVLLPPEFAAVLEAACSAS